MVGIAHHFHGSPPRQVRAPRRRQHLVNCRYPTGPLERGSTNVATSRSTSQPSDASATRPEGASLKAPQAVVPSPRRALAPQLRPTWPDPTNLWSFASSLAERRASRPSRFSWSAPNWSAFPPTHITKVCLWSRPSHGMS